MSEMKMEYSADKTSIKVTFPDGTVEEYLHSDELYLIKIGLRQLECMRDLYTNTGRPVTGALLADISGYRNMLAHPELGREYIKTRQKEIDNKESVAASKVRPGHFRAEMN